MDRPIIRDNPKNRRSYQERRQQQAMLLLEYMRRFAGTVMELVDKDILTRLFRVIMQGGSHDES